MPPTARIIRQIFYFLTGVRNMAERTIDWDAIEAAYRHTGAPIRRLARRYGTPESTIRARAKRCRWERAQRPWALRIVSDDARAVGLTPLEYMLAVMRDETLDADLRADAALAALPYCHTKVGRGQ